MADKEKYMINIQGNLIEVSKDVYYAYFHMERQERTQEEKKQRNEVMSYDALDDGETLGMENIADMSTPSMEDLAIAQELHDRLHHAVEALPKADIPLTPGTATMNLHRSAEKSTVTAILFTVCTLISAHPMALITITPLASSPVLRVQPKLKTLALIKCLSTTKALLRPLSAAVRQALTSRLTAVMQEQTFTLRLTAQVLSAVPPREWIPPFPTAIHSLQ